MSGTQVSSAPNVMFDPLMAGRQTAQQNELMQQQQTLTDNDIAMTGQAAAPLLNLNEDQAAAAYPGWLQEMRSRGLAKYAPATYPGHAATAALVQRAMPILKQIETGFLIPPGSADATKRLNDIYTGAFAGTGIGATTGGGTGGTGGDGLTGDKAHDLPLIAQRESGGNPTVLNYVARGDPTAYARGATASGKYQIVNSTWREGMQLAGLDPAQYPTARDAPEAVQDKVASSIYDKYGNKPWQKGPQDWVKDEQGRYQLATVRPPAGAPGGAPTIAPPGTPPGAPARPSPNRVASTAPVITGDSLASPQGLGGTGVVGDSAAKVLARVQAESRAGKYDGKPVVLSTGASNDFGSDLGSVEQQLREAQGGNAGKITVLGVGPAVEAKAPGTNAKLQALAKSYGADFVPLPADQMSPDGVHPTAQGYATLKAAVASPQGAPGGVAARVGGTDVAGPGAGGAPGGDLVGPRPLPPMGPGSPVVTPQSLANTPAPQPQAQVPQPPANRVMPGSPDGPSAPIPPPPAQQPPPSARAALPRAADVPQGLDSPQIQQAQRYRQAAAQLEIEAARNPFDKRLQADAAAKAADLKQRAEILEKTDTVVQTQDGQLHVATGKIDEPAKPLADYHETSPGSGIWVGGPGTEPRFQPPGRLIIDKAGDVWRTTTGGAEKLSRLDPVAVAALNEAAAAGTATGTAVAKQLPDLMERARNAAAQEGQIDYATNQLREAAKGGVPSGYFSQGLATAAAAAKSLGIDTSSLGVNPEAVGNIQTAQKTLSVIGGAILRQALGPGSAITDSKIEQFIHTQPGIETDPQALQRIMAWARSQYTYERELGTAAVTEAAKPENAGRLPAHWLPAYYRDHGFAPIYDPGTQEMRQPDGTQPTRTTAPASQNAPAFQEGQTATAKDGHKIVFRNGNWMPQ